MTRAFMLAVLFALSSCAAAASRPEAETCRLIEVYVRSGCPHCALAKGYLETLSLRRPDVEIRQYDLAENPLYREQFIALTMRLGIEQPGVPTFLICGKVIVGYSDRRTPAEIEAIIGGPGTMPGIVN